MRPITNIAIAACVLLLGACRQTSYVIPVGNGHVNMIFSNSAGTNSLVLGQDYTTAHGDHVKVSAFKYYISNVKLGGSNVSYTEPESYHLIDHNNMAGATFQLNNMQYGQYTSVTFTLGVDSTRNVSGAQTGALDPANNMFWNWNTGYVMMKLEGTSPQSLQPGNAVTYHIGGYYGANTALRTVTLNLPHPVSVTGDVSAISHINITADVLAIFKAPHMIDLSITNTVQNPGTDVSTIADNYANMFSVASSGI